MAQHNFVLCFDILLLYAASAPTGISLQGAFVDLNIMWIGDEFGTER